MVLNAEIVTDSLPCPNDFTRRGLWPVPKQHLRQRDQTDRLGQYDGGKAHPEDAPFQAGVALATIDVSQGEVARGDRNQC
jgi:hypothetical protein